MNIAAWAAVLAAVAALSAAGLVLYRSQSAPAQQGFVIVEANHSATTDAQSAVSAQESDAASGEDGGVVSAAESHGGSARSGGGDDASRLSAQFARHRAAIEACVRAHRGASAEIEAIRFVVAGDGSVQSAEVLPERAAQSALGECVAGVARRARFTGIERAGVFRLPVVLRGP